MFTSSHPFSAARPLLAMKSGADCGGAIYKKSKLCYSDSPLSRFLNVAILLSLST